MDIAKATVIIPAYGATPHLARVLTALSNGALKPDEIIVSHSGEHDPSEEILARFPNVTVLHSDLRLFAGAARNRGARIAKNPILAFCDSDTVPVHNWLGNGCAGLMQHEGSFIVGSVGHTLTGENSDAQNSDARNSSNGGYWGMATWISEFSEQAPWRPQGNQTGGASCNFICLAADMQAVGYFPETLLVAEDTLLFHQLRTHGLKQVFLPQVQVNHCNISGFAHFSRHIFGHGVAFARLRSRHRLGGSFAIKFWPLSWMLGIAKFIRITGRIVKSGKGSIKRLAYFLPAVLIGAIIWQGGVFKALMSKD